MNVREVELVVPAQAELGECPVWDEAAQELLWVDILQGLVHRYEPATGNSSHLAVGQPIGAVAPRVSGGYVLALRDGFAIVEDADQTAHIVAPVELDAPENRMNDGKCDRAGRFWAGTVSSEADSGAGALYRLDPDYTVTKILEGVTMSNGLAWSPGEDVMYFIDTATQRVDAFDFESVSGRIEHRRPVIEIPVEDGSPDGMTSDVDGNLWIAVYGSSQVRCYAPDGRLEEVVELPVPGVTSCAFGGVDCRDLYITTAPLGVSEAEYRERPGTGGLYRVRPGVKGAPPNSFRG